MSRPALLESVMMTAILISIISHMHFNQSYDLERQYAII